MTKIKTNEELRAAFKDNPLYRSSAFYPFKHDVIEWFLAERTQTLEGVKGQILSIFAEEVHRAHMSENGKSKTVRLSAASRRISSLLDTLIIGKEDT